MRLFVTGGSSVLGRALRPLAGLAGHELSARGRDELDLLDAGAVAAAVAGCDAIVHLATRIPPLEVPGAAAAWLASDRLRTQAAGILVDAGLAAGVDAYVQPSVALVYPPDAPADEDTPLGALAPALRSCLEAERQAARFARDGGRAIVLRLGLLDGPGCGEASANERFGATLHVSDAADALLRALTAPSGIYNVCRDGERISNERFRRATGWHPRVEHAAAAIESARRRRTALDVGSGPS